MSSEAKTSFETELDNGFAKLKAILMKNQNKLEKYNQSYFFEELITNVLDHIDSYRGDDHDGVLLDYNGMKVQIDKKIAPLMKELWEAKIETSNSCEDNVPKGYVWIEFANEQSFRRFMNIMFKKEFCKNDIFRRAVSGWDTDGKCWKFNINVDSQDNYVDYETGEIANPDARCKEVKLWHSVRFPHKDLEYVIGKIKAFNKK
jgi:hypothetical protein